MPDNLPSLNQVYDIARVCHEANRAYCVGHGDHTHLPWDQTPSDLKQSIRSGVMFLAEEPLAGPDEAHERWVDYKVEQGWAYGMEKDVALKIHPNLVVSSQLPPVEQAKDRLFCAIVRALLADGSQG